MNTWSNSRRTIRIEMLRWTMATAILAAAAPALAQDDPAAPAAPAPAEPAAPAPTEPAAPAESSESSEAPPVSTAGATPTATPAAPIEPAVPDAAPVDPTVAGSAGEPLPEQPVGAPASDTLAGAVDPVAPTGATPRLTVALPPPPSLADELPIPTLTIDRIPPSTSFEFALQVSYGSVAYFRDTVPPWIGFGMRAGWGKNFGLHRFGVAGILAAEGDIGVHTQLSLEPMAAWDFVSRNGLLLGAGVGPAVVYSVQSSTVETEYSFDVAPSAAARIGWSQTWSRVGRRLFLFLEPKVRVASGQVSPVVALAVGSGAGR